MDFTFTGKRALVTGGGRGIGRDIARSLVKHGARTFVLTKSSSSVDSLRQEDPDIEVIQVDMTDWESTRKAVESILPIDLLVNNAGIFRLLPFLDATETDISDHFSIHYKATFNVSQVVAQDLIQRQMPGSIVNISSHSSQRRYPALTVYGSIKAAVDSLTKYMALEAGPRQIRVNAVNPTVVPTDLSKPITENDFFMDILRSKVPLGRMGEVKEVSDVVLFLLSDHASLVNGVTLMIDGGLAV